MPEHRSGTPHITTTGTLIGSVAILMWGMLGVLGTLSASMPPYFVLTFCFLIASLIGVMLCWRNNMRPLSLFSWPMVLFVGLLSLYHLTYLQAFHYAAALPVSLINYLWPAFLILIGNRFFQLNSGKAGVAGAAVGFFGVALLIAGGSVGFEISDAFGYGLALLGAVLWATYSNLRRHDKASVIGSMTTICFGAALVCAIPLLVTKNPVFSASLADWGVILALGFGPAGGAFFLWDYGMKNGNAALLSVLGYSAPLVSTVLMITLGLGAFSWLVVLATSLIASGGLIVHFGTEAKSKV